jgi:CubicO group peptidase (beta-lactamase class C family)
LIRGFYENAIFRRADPKHRTINEFIQEEIALPLGVEFYFGIPKTIEENEFSRVSKLYESSKLQVFFKLLLPFFLEEYAPFILDLLPLPRLTTFTKNAIRNAFDKSKPTVNNQLPGLEPHGLNPQVFLTKEALRIQGPSFNGLTNAASLAKIAGCLANGGELDGVRLLSKKGFEEAHRLMEPVSEGVFDTTIHFTQAGWATHPTYPVLAEPSQKDFFGWCGWGGSYFVWDPVHNIGFSYVMNAMKQDYWVASALMEALAKDLASR